MQTLRRLGVIMPEAIATRVLGGTPQAGSQGATPVVVTGVAPGS